jgi:hypothetical protein
MTGFEFTGQVVPQVESLWPRFARGWTEGQQRLVGKRMNAFEAGAVVTQLEMHRLDEPDARAPAFKEVIAKLWSLRRRREEASDKTDGGDIRSILREWSRTKSDDDLLHLRYIAQGNVEARNPSYWAMVEASELRSFLSLIVCWSVHTERPLTWAPGTWEWDELYIEYDLAEKARMTANRGALANV